MKNSVDESRWNRGSWIALGASILLLLMLVPANAYRYARPTDGWEFTDDGNIFVANHLGLPSDLMPGDVPLRISNVEIGNLINASMNHAGTLPQDWHAGATLPYVVQRGDQTLTVNVPIGHWSPSGLWNAFAFNWLEYGIALLYLGIGIFVFALRPANLAAQVLLFLGSVRLTMSLAQFVPLSLADYGDLIAVNGVSLLGFYIWGLLLFPTLLLLTLVFPKPKRPYRTHPILTLACLYLVTPLLLLVFGQGSDEAGPTVGFGMVAVFGLLAVVSIIHTLITSRGDRVARAQILWVGLGIAIVTGFQFLSNSIGFLGVPISDTPPDWFLAFSSLIYLVVPVTIAIAILRYRLFDIDVIIRRTLTYALVTAMLLVVFFGMVVLLQQIFATVTGSGQNELVTVLSTLAIAALFVPLRSRVQNWIDRRFNRRRYDAQQVMTQFGSTVQNETDLEQLTAQLVQVVNETMQPNRVSVWLRKESKSN